MISPLSAAELLGIWERGTSAQPVERALALLAAAHPDLTVSALAEFSVGQRDARLLSLREAIFGPRLVGVVDCPECDEKLELDFAMDDIRAENHAAAATTVMNVDGYELSFRLPNSMDILAIADQRDVSSARRLLLDRCLLKVNGKQDEGADRLPDVVIDAIAERMGQLDPQANVQLALTCSRCNNRWLANLDIVSFLWSEINGWALRVLREVHTLASAYGWREADILALSPRRRQLYLGMIGG